MGQAKEQTDLAVKLLLAQLRESVRNELLEELRQGMPATPEAKPATPRPDIRRPSGDGRSPRPCLAEGCPRKGAPRFSWYCGEHRTLASPRKPKPARKAKRPVKPKGEASPAMSANGVNSDVVKHETPPPVAHKKAGKPKTVAEFQALTA